MKILWMIVKFILANAGLIIVSSTLIGYIVRGFIQPGVQNPNGEHKAEWNKINPTKGLIFSMLGLVTTVALVYFLNQHANWFIIAGILLWMLSRIKDLITEIRTGIKTTSQTMTKDKLDLVFTALSWIGFIAFNYGLYLLWIK